MSITDDIKQQWNSGGMLKRLLMINIGVFLAIWAVELVPWLFGMKGTSGYLLDELMASNDASLLRKPWSPITYMFTHQAPMHLFWNMVMFWFSAQIFQSILGDKRLLGNYLLGGFAGFLFYVLGSFAPGRLGLESHGAILGASAAVMSVLIGIASYRPDMQMNLMLIGPVRLKYIGIAILVLDLIGIREGGNTGGHLAHLGGALYGFLAARQLAQGNDWSLNFVLWLERILKLLTPRKGPRMRVEKRPSTRGTATDADYNAAKKRKQERIDAILDKISRSGYDSLSKAERDLLSMKATTAETKGPARWYRPIWWVNLLAVVALLLAYLSTRVSPATCWPLALFGMGYPYILGANLLCMAWWLVFRRKRTWLSLIVILLGWSYLGEYVQLVGDRNAPQDVRTPFTIMSWNVRLFDLYNWTHNQQTRDEMMDLIRVEDPDILCMQEFLHVDGGNSLDAKAPLMTNYRYIACADTYTAHARGYHMGIAIFSTWPVIAQGTIHFPDELNNLCLWADLRIGTDTVRVYTAHLASLRFNDPDYAFMRSLDQGGGSDSIRTAGPRIMGRLKDAFVRRSREVSRITEHIRNCPWPIVYCGDLNDTPMSYSYHGLRHAGLEDAFVESGQGLGHTYIGEFPSFRIDHLLHGPTVRSWGMRTLPDELSDHRPIICSMGVKDGVEGVRSPK